jgi:hypothetical protein
MVGLVLDPSIEIEVAWVTPCDTKGSKGAFALEPAALEKRD